MTVTPEMLMLDPPVLEIVRVFIWVLPTSTLPKLKLEGALR